MTLHKVQDLGKIQYSRGVGRCSELGGYNDHQDKFVWKKSHSYGVTVKQGVLQHHLLPTPMISQLSKLTCICEWSLVSKVCTSTETYFLYKVDITQNIDN